MILNQVWIINRATIPVQPNALIGELAAEVFIFVVDRATRMEPATRRRNYQRRRQAFNTSETPFDLDVRQAGNELLRVGMLRTEENIIDRRKLHQVTGIHHT